MLNNFIVYYETSFTSNLHFWFAFSSAEAMGYPPIPAFLDPTLTQADLPRGASFASAGSGYDDLTANISVSLNMFPFLLLLTKT